MYNAIDTEYKMANYYGAHSRRVFTKGLASVLRGVSRTLEHYIQMYL
jgi:hypothetical protein